MTEKKRDWRGEKEILGFSIRPNAKFRRVGCNSGVTRNSEDDRADYRRSFDRRRHRNDDEISPFFPIDG